MAATTRVVRTANIVAFAAVLVFALIQPWQSAYLYVPLQSPNYLTVDNKYASWSLRIGHVGGVHGFDAGFAQTNPIQTSFLRQHKPFPVNWIVDWGFKIRCDSPYVLIFTPLYFPVLVLAFWPTASILHRFRRRTGSSRNQPASGSPYCPPSVGCG